MKWIQQGDVTIRPLSGGIPPTANRLSHKTLAEGEATGHHHVAVAEDVTLYATKDGRLVMDAPSGTTIKHEEHGAVEVPSGIWEVGRVQEYDHFAEEARNVQD
jgi:hypothetical protein